MPKCGLSLDGVSQAWALEVQLVTRLNTVGRLVEAHPSSKELKTCNLDVSHNAVLMKPLLERMAADANWELFSLPTVAKELPASTQLNAFSTSFIHM